MNVRGGMHLLDWCRNFVFTTFGKRTLGAMALLVDEEDRVVLIRQTYGLQIWTLPGGGVKRSESFADAAAREASEEAGVRVRPDATVELVGVYFKRSWRWSDHIAVYVIRGFDDVPTKASREIAAVERYPLSDLPRDMSPAARRRIAEWQGTQPVSPTW